MHSSSTLHPTRRRRWLAPLLVLPCIGLVLSGVITWLNVGWSDDFVARWLRAFATALPVMPVGLALMLVLDRALTPRVRTLPPVSAKILLALLTACVMELLMAAVVTLSNRGPGAGFAPAWAAAFVKSLPVGVLIGLTMAFVVKPRLARWIGATPGAAR